jgi:MHS family proline/betaine transporter-like MFS transporter
MYDRESKKVNMLTGCGAILELYDFILYMTFSKEIANVFFTEITNLQAKLFLTIAIFSVTYIVRPFAGIILGMIGDVIGRRKVLLFTILLMGICSLAMGLMPGYEYLGISAGFMVILFRILQGFALGGELPGACVILYESVKGKIGFASAMLFTFVTASFLLCGLITYFLEMMFHEYAWRVGFIIGGLLGFIGYYIRRNLSESPEFQNIHNQEKHSFKSLISTYGLNIFGGIFIVITVAFSGIMLTLYTRKFVEGLLPNYDPASISLLLTPALLTLTVSTFVFGYLSDKVGIVKTFTLGALLTAIMSAPIFYIMSAFATPQVIAIALMVIMLSGGLVTASFIVLLCDLFPTDIRLSGVGISYNLAFAIVGGIGPLVSTTIITTTNYYFLGPAIVGLICGIIGLLGVIIYYKKGGYYKSNSNLIVKL